MDPSLPGGMNGTLLKEGYKNVAWQTVEDIWVKNKKISYSGLEAEVGGIYRINNLAISLGMQTNSFKMFEGCLGIGIMF